MIYKKDDTSLLIRVYPRNARLVLLFLKINTMYQIIKPKRKTSISIDAEKELDKINTSISDKNSQQTRNRIEPL